jgi:hypothetical protein
MTPTPDQEDSDVTDPTIGELLDLLGAQRTTEADGARFREVDLHPVMLLLSESGFSPEAFAARLEQEGLSREEADVLLSWARAAESHDGAALPDGTTLSRIDT